MIRKRKIEKGSMPWVHPGLPKKESITVFELTDALNTFFENYLKGSMTLEVSGMSYNNVIISADHLAYMLKLVGEYGAQTQVLNIKLTVNDTNLTLETTFNNGKPDLDTLANIAAASNKAGFSLELYGAHMIFKAEIITDTTLSVYATTSKRLLLSLRTVFFAK